MGVDAKHPQYTPERLAEWQLMRDAMDGESAIKSRGKTHLPMPSSYAALPDGGTEAYAAYVARASFPELLAPAVSGMVGVAHAKEIGIVVPEALKFLWENADGRGMPLEELHRQITRELLVAGRYGLLADAPEAGGEPYLAGYTAETIINWDEGLFVLDETGPVRVGYDWEKRVQFRVLSIEGGRYQQEVHAGVVPKLTGAAAPVASGGKALDFIPFAVASSIDQKPDIRTPPLIGVARAAKGAYQLDADYRHQLYWSGQETLVVINGEAPEAVGAGAVIAIQTAEGQQASVEYVSPSCSGIEAHKVAIDGKKQDAISAGAKLLEQQDRAQESGEARKLRFQADTATLQSVVRSSCGLLEKGLRFIAQIKGLAPDTVNVPVPEALLDATMTPADAEALMRVWLEGGISYQTFYEALQRGGLASPERDHAVEFKLRDAERDPDEESDETG
ncbi:DUF4055 domain-containing protein [Paracoccus sp. (in: a-proteobacteria)]|uniref:DUF4055 domain-containing protein n=1 Tax=Paracoccus sp. TaxID=267 RepID=UPI0028AB949D|nr:DUF4055 domain-containing protein [Paracoccus sp. (in: a-proteobacteria)]